ncbi:nuclear transport factor 2 family protein [Empedobacter falsenii]|uniref:Nuclear transport factor 2 family protein n=1 Tax=Empedobacter falsenii TaxID=343874 RepID=A0AAW7DL46_9FLAO|nr:nuclear transport factor 2 family protein [Empedobacter falsenii]MDM1552716.1 nuclear transport factor 2 family protein [Empedobacter falsenii]
MQIFIDNYINSYMPTQTRQIVDQMLEAFNAKDVDAVVSTFTDDAILIYHGTQVMPAAKFQGKEGARMFFEFNINALDVVFFKANQFVEQDNTVVILGNEHFISKEDGTHLKNSWVQVYTISNGLISKMEEFATSAQPNQYGGNAGGV